MRGLLSFLLIRVGDSMTLIPMSKEFKRMATKNAKRAAAEQEILRTLKVMEPGGANAKRYEEMFAKMSDKDFHVLMEDIRDGKRKLVVFAPNMKTTLKVPDLIAAAKRVNAKIFDRIKLWDPVGHRYFTTPKEYLVLRLPVRRLKQFLVDKMSIPESDRRISKFTGQVVKPDKGSSVSAIELQTIVSKGLDNVVVELATVRGGNPDAYAGFRASLEETGSATLGEVDPAQRVRSVEVSSVWLKGMLIDNNF